MNSNVEILLVDDVPTTRELLRGLVLSVLSPPRHNVNTNIYQAASATEASILINKKNIDLAFLDIDLPDGSGLDLIDVVKSNHPKSTIVMVSGDSSMPSVKKAISKGVSGFIVKPFNRARVQEAVDNCMKKLAKAG